MNDSALMIGYMIGALIICALVYIVLTFPFYKLAKKANDKNAFWAFIPVLNLFLIIKLARISYLWSLFYISPIILMILSLAVQSPGLFVISCVIYYITIPVSFYLYARFFQAYGQSGWLCLTLFVNLALIIILWVFAFDKNIKYRYLEDEENQLDKEEGI